MTNLPQVILSEAFLNRDFGSEEAREHAIQGAKTVMTSLISQDEDVLALIRQDHFDPNALLRISVGSSTYDIPFMSLFMSRTQSPALREALREKIALFDQVNGGPKTGLYSPLALSARRGCRHMDLLLSHPNIDPNIPMWERNCEDTVRASGKDFTFDKNSGGLSLGANDRALDAVCTHIMRKSNQRKSKPSNGDGIQRSEQYQRFFEYAAALLDAGAIPTNSFLKMLEQPDSAKAFYKKLMDELREKYAQMRTRNQEILQETLPVSEITAQDLKHAYGLKNLNEIFVIAQHDEAMSEQIFSLRDSLPNWMQAKYAPAFALLEQSANRWQDRLAEQPRSSWAKGEGAS